MFDKQKIEEIRQAKQAWEAGALGPHGEKTPERRRTYRNDVGVEVGALYTPADLAEADFDYARDLGFPGQYPFTRGITPGMFRTEAPLLRVYAGYGSPEASNAYYQYLLELGAEEIVMAVDLPTQVGYDSDHVMAQGEVGRVGVAIDSLRDMEVLFDGIPLSRMKRVSMLGNSFGPLALALFVALGEKQGLTPADFVVDLQNDVLKEYIARGTQFLPIRPALRLAVDVVEYCARRIPRWYPLTVCVNHINSAGAGSSRGTAFALANAICYVEEALRRGLEIDQFASQLTMFLDEREDFFVAVANLRATRRVWARLMKERFGARDPRSMGLHITSYGHGGETVHEPLNNITRITLGTLAYVLGGVTFLYNGSYDEALSIPSREAVRVAIRMQQILAHELGVANTVDPLGGSYYVESLTLGIHDDIVRELERIEARGGALRCIEEGDFRQAIAEGAVRRQAAFDQGERISVGVNKFRMEAPVPRSNFRADPSVAQRQAERLGQVKRDRDAARVRAALADVAAAARGTANTVPPILEAVRAYATLGEICDALRAVFGEYKPDVTY
ncbi:MAG: methylmalonyl-CoA mutase [Candidatus Rokubacteria bacterium]|nr:methylmalonyl-CoA mutase [Candidatus Rokubacteria bacterium]